MSFLLFCQWPCQLQSWLHLCQPLWEAIWCTPVLMQWCMLLHRASRMVALRFSMPSPRPHQQCRFHMGKSRIRVRLDPEKFDVWTPILPTAHLISFSLAIHIHSIKQHLLLNRQNVSSSTWVLYCICEKLFKQSIFFSLAATIATWTQENRCLSCIACIIALSIQNNILLSLETDLALFSILGTNFLKSK